ncbi:nuclear transport factor 2 family protein [Rhodococcus spelaei]|uniref:Nuclear transport factor 2 family protein n=1 Tax=Rhodococcus spelaei TaxID=2546320 RepID=A0A541BNW5_9NOCA|nr:nuclear transport factor 2 family protein [Rhodococcus spelaei]TQF74024.1 nuclear transport factor 2 family protein [Rhodococcus spelaei]
MDLQTIGDRIEITDLLTRYAHAVDTKDWSLYRTVFTPDAHIDYSATGGPLGTVEEVVSALTPMLDLFTQTQHFVSNLTVGLAGDEATVRAMFFNPMVVKPGKQFFCGGWYNHELVRTEDGWRSRRLVEESAWFENLAEAFAD